MPFFGLGLHILVALFFAVHAMRSGQQMYWLLILFSFPLLGSIVYFLVIYLPGSRLERGARSAVAIAAKSLDPTRELREARAAFDYTPTAQNQMRLARALLDNGAAEEAASHYEACLKGPFAEDAEIKLCAAQAFMHSGRAAQAVGHLEAIKTRDANFRAEQVSLLLARSLALAGRQADAKQEFEYALRRFGSFEAHAEFAIWAYSVGDNTVSVAMQNEVDTIMSHWSRHSRELNQPTVQRLKAAAELARKRL